MEYIRYSNATATMEQEDDDVLGDVGTSARVTRGRSRGRWFLHTLERTQSVEAALVVGVSDFPCSLLALNHRNEQLSINWLLIRLSV